MPLGAKNLSSWLGYTPQNNTQAVAVCSVMQNLTAMGIQEIRLRFAHEANYYQTAAGGNTYTGTASDFQIGWQTVYNACKGISSVKMMWTPNFCSDFSQYSAYAPQDMTTVSYAGIDWYPTSLPTTSQFVNTMSQFYNAYVQPNNNVQFALGEAGLHYTASIKDKVQWLSNIVAAKSSFPKFTSVTWFNFNGPDGGFNCASLFLRFFLC